MRNIKISESRAFQGVWIPERLYRDNTLNWLEKITLVEIASLSANGECFANNQHFANFLGVSKRRAEQIISKLRDDGYITSQIIYNGNEVERRVLRVKDSLGFSKKKR